MQSMLKVLLIALISVSTLSLADNESESRYEADLLDNVSWMCVVRNARGVRFEGVGRNRVLARDRAERKCQVATPGHANRCFFMHCRPF